MQTPPRLALWIIEHATPPRDRDAVVGDVIEDFHRLAEHDAAAARRWLRRQARRSLVPGLRRQWSAASLPPSTGRIPMRGFLRDLRFGVRLLRHQPLMAAAGMVSLAVGLGLNLLLFAVANAILLRPLPLRDADRLVMLQQQRATGLALDFSYPAYLHLRGASGGALDMLAAYCSSSATAQVNGRSVSIQGELVTGNLFPGLGVSMTLGRGLSDADDRSGAPPVVVVSEAFWRRHFGTAALSGQGLVLNERAFTIVGVADSRFMGMEIGRHAHFWVPISHMEAIARKDIRASARVPWLALIGRLAPGVESATAESRLAPASDSFFKALGFPPQLLILANGSQGDSDLPRTLGARLRVLAGAALFVLLIACVNVANVQLARASARARELAVRAALGAARWRLIRLLIADALLLTVPAGLAALAFAALARQGAAGLIARYGEPVALSLPIDWRVASAALGMTVAAALIVGGVSAWLATRRSPSIMLAEDPRTSTGSSRAQRALVVVQFALSMTLIAAAALLARTVGELRGADIGVARNVALIDVSPQSAGLQEDAAARYFERALEAAVSVPGVQAAAMSQMMPLDFGGARMTVEVDGYTPAAGEDMEINNLRVSRDYFAVMDIRILAGRVFDERDTPAQPARVVINQTMANRFWPNGDAVGRFVRFPNEGLCEVIGVVADARYRMVREARRATFYRPWTQRPATWGVVHARTHGAPAATLGEIERAIAAVDPDVPVARALTLEGQLDRNIADERMARSVAIALGVAALVLAATGLYATMAFAVRRRTREIGVRMALGAQRADVGAMILRQGLELVGVGTALGAAGAFWAGRTIESQLYGVSASDAVSFGAAAAVLASVALLAAWLPARRATHVDPVIALRE